MKMNKQYITIRGIKYKEVDIEEMNEGDKVYLLYQHPDGDYYKTEYLISDPGEHLLQDYYSGKRRYYNGPELNYVLAVEEKVTDIIEKEKVMMTNTDKGKVIDMTIPETKEDLMDALCGYDDDLEELLLIIESFKEAQIGSDKLSKIWGISSDHLNFPKAFEEVLPMVLEMGDVILNNMQNLVLETEKALDMRERDALLAWDLVYKANNKMIALRAMARNIKTE